MKDKIKLYQHIPAAVAQFCHAAPVASFKGFIKCSILQMQCPEHSHCKSNQKHSTAERPQSTVQSELLLFRTAPGMESFSSIYHRIGLKWNGDALCELRVPCGLSSPSCVLPVSTTEHERSVSLGETALTGADCCTWEENVQLHLSEKCQSSSIWKTRLEELCLGDVQLIIGFFWALPRIKWVCKQVNAHYYFLKLIYLALWNNYFDCATVFLNIALLFCIQAEGCKLYDF